MKTAVEVRVFCPIYNTEKTVYCIPMPVGHLHPNGCEDRCGNELCWKCDAIAVEKAKKQLADFESGDFFINKP